MVSRRDRTGIARNRHGAGALGCLLPVLVITIIGYFAVHASDAGFSYYRLQDAMKQEARFSHRKTDEQIKMRLRSFVDSLGMPTAARTINVRRTEERITISADYVETIDFPFFSKAIDFHPKAERRF